MPTNEKLGYVIHLMFHPGMGWQIFNGLTDGRGNNGINETVVNRLAESLQDERYHNQVCDLVFGLAAEHFGLAKSEMQYREEAGVHYYVVGCQVAERAQFACAD